MNGGKSRGEASLQPMAVADAAGFAPAGAKQELQATATVWARDMIRFLREPHRVMGAMAQPLLFWLVLGTGIGSTFQPRSFPEGFSYLGFFYPGVIGLTLLFTSIFSTISVITDREHGFLKQMLVSPVSRASIVMGKVLAGASTAMLQGVILLALAPAAGLPLRPVSALLLMLTMGIVALGLTALGLAIAWRMTSTQGFHMVMNFFLFPMWLLSGAMFPLEGLPLAMRALMYVNPLTYGIDGLRGLFVDPGVLPAGFVQFSVGVNLLAVTAFSGLLILIALRACREQR